MTFYKDFCEFSFPCFPIPRFFYGESFENEPMAGIVCEDFSGIGASIDFVPGFSDRQVTQLMEALAGFHSEIIRRTAEIPWQNYGNALYDACYIRMLVSFDSKLDCFLVRYSSLIHCNSKTSAHRNFPGESRP